MGEQQDPLRDGRMTRVSDHHIRGMSHVLNPKKKDKSKGGKHNSRSKDVSDSDDNLGSKNKLDNSSFL